MARDAAMVRELWRVNRVYWLVVLYCAAWTIVRTNGRDGAPPLSASIRLPLAITFAVAITSLALRTRVALRRGGYGRTHPNRIGWIFTALDLVAVSAGLRLTGGLASGLWPILFLIVVAETVLEPYREAWMVRIGALVALLIAATPIPLRGGAWIFDAATRVVFLLAVASVARRLRESAEREKSELAALRAEVALADQRARLSREVHDGVGNSLAAAVLRLEFAARLSDRGQSIGAESTAELLREEAQVLRQAMTSVRDWTFWTRPWLVPDLGSSDGVARVPSETLRAEIERFSRRVGLPIDLAGGEVLDSLGSRAETVRLTLFRITQEALTNTAKHAAGATGAWVSLRRELDRAVILVIRDDGPGFEAAGSGVGIGSMRERAQGAGGSLTVETAPGAGVTVTARLPLP